MMFFSWKPNRRNAHSRAKELMTDEFLWSPIEHFSPFGNDDGADAVYEFRKWRKKNVSKNPSLFIAELLNEWDYNTYDYTKTNEEEIKSFINSKSIGDRLFLGIDWVIIATTFGQLIIEGVIESQLKNLCLTALKRQIQPFAMELYSEEDHEERFNNFNRMIEVIQSA